MKNYRVDEEAVRAVPRPDFTESWKPWSHHDVLEALIRATERLDIVPDRKQYSLTEDGGVMVGVWTIQRDAKLGGRHERISPTIIVRNSINKKRSLALNIGTDRWICSNLCIMGDFLEFRKHTANLDEISLEKMMYRGVVKMAEKFKKAVSFHKAMHEVKISEQEMKALAYDAALRHQIITRGDLQEFNHLLFDADNDYKPNELFGFHGACTQIMNELPLTGRTGFQDRNLALQKLITDRYGNILPAI